MTREEFIEKISPWMTEETCKNLADAAEIYFSSNSHGTCYEKMAFYMGDYPDDPDGLADFLQEYIDTMYAADDLEAMAHAMATEW